MKNKKWIWIVIVVLVMIVTLWGVYKIIVDEWSRDLLSHTRAPTTKPRFTASIIIDTVRKTPTASPIITTFPTSEPELIPTVVTPEPTPVPTPKIVIPSTPGFYHITAYPTPNPNPITLFIEGYSNFDVSSYDYTIIDKNESDTWDKYQRFASTMRGLVELDQSKYGYKYNVVLVSFINDVYQFDNPSFLADNGLDLNAELTIMKSGYGWAIVKLTNNTREGVKQAIILLTQDKNVKSISPNIIIPLIDNIDPTAPPPIITTTNPITSVPTEMPTATP